uniref:Uncharacterized protein n=1 Tax=Neobodo designis TaxID=312471 RepID=A0A7S1QNC7_NEODS|mmetsp:Transcript_49205/g.151931  ORF Transcript_49205/g.151931 Transcript_49205/m.151931 type:complete len:262 (+) Transcript_49205:31-816(+)
MLRRAVAAATQRSRAVCAAAAGIDVAAASAVRWNYGFSTPSGTAGWSAVPPTSDEARQLDADAVANDATSGTAALVRCVEKEMDDEELRIDKEAPDLPSGWDITHEEGASYWTMTRVWEGKERHTVRGQLTVRDVALDPECDIRGEHFPFRFIVENLFTGTVMDFALDVVEGECIVDNIRTFDSAEQALNESYVAAYEREKAYPGPSLDESEEEVLDGIQAYLAERQVDDQMAEFVGQYSVWVEQLEYERWLRELKSFLTA